MQDQRRARNAEIALLWLDKLEEQTFGITNRDERMKRNLLSGGSNPSMGRPDNDCLAEPSDALRVTPATLLGSTDSMVLAMRAFHGLNRGEQHRVVRAMREWKASRALGVSLPGATLGGR